MNMGRVYRFGVWAVGAILTVACSDASSSKKSAVSSLSAPAPLSARRIANGIPAIQARLESARSVEAHGEAFLLASTSGNAPEHHAGSFSVSAPSTLAQSVRLSRDEDADTWLDVRPLGLRAATPGKVEQST